MLSKILPQSFIPSCLLTMTASALFFFSLWMPAYFPLEYHFGASFILFVLLAIAAFNTGRIFYEAKN